MEVTVISLSLPSSSEKFMFVLAGFLMGPLATQPTQGENITLQSSLNSLTQGSEYYHEKDVEHTKVTGTVSYNPALADVVSTPSSSLPAQISYKCKTYTGTNTSITAYYGLASDRIVVEEIGYYHYLIGVDLSDRYNPILYTVAAQNISATSANSITLTRSRYKFQSMSNTLVSFKRYDDQVRTSWPAKFLSSWSDLTYDRIKSLWVNAGGDTLNSTFGTPEAATPYTGLTPPSFSVQSLSKYIDSLVTSDLAKSASPSEEDYGVLAMEASEKVNANHTNMIAFLRDLRKPQEMIPKLKKLLDLKGHAGNYLAVNYGILPTISDLQEIIGAFKSVQPYIDGNGFKTYNAFRTSSSASGDYSSSVEQRIKIAIDEEDSDLSRLAAKVDSMGFALTLENVWDLIPYSFVIDWFIDIGGFLERADSRMRLMRLNIRYATMSRKLTRSKKLSASQLYPISGTINMVQYSRWTTSHCPEPPLFFRNTNSVSNHWLESSALILQRAK
jgi:hypothetical protein